MNIYFPISPGKLSAENDRLIPEWNQQWQQRTKFVPVHLTLAGPPACPCESFGMSADALAGHGDAEQFLFCTSARVFPRPHFSIPKWRLPTAFSLSNPTLLLLTRPQLKEIALRMRDILHKSWAKQCRNWKDLSKAIIGPDDNGATRIACKLTLIDHPRDGWQFSPAVYFPPTMQTNDLLAEIGSLIKRPGLDI